MVDVLKLGSDDDHTNNSKIAFLLLNISHSYIELFGFHLPWSRYQLFTHCHESSSRNLHYRF